MGFRNLKACGLLSSEASTQFKGLKVSKILDFIG